MSEPRRERARRLLTTPEAGAALAVVVFVAISAWWLARDLRVVNIDNGKHMLIAVRRYQDLVTGRLLEPFTTFDIYPPGVHLVGAVASLIFGQTMFVMVMALNVVFVPLLALGCYGVASLAFDRRTGLLAVVFALSVPLVLSMFHVFFVDGPEAAMVAVTVWLLLRADSFARPRIAALAGLAAALGMYTKQTFVLFVAGVVLVQLLRGGWRNWRGWLLFGGVLVAFAGPWYAYHYADLHGQATGSLSSAAQVMWYSSVPYPPRESIANFTWYFWNLINNQLYLPMTLLLAAGGAWSLRELVRRPLRHPLLPELVVGGLGGYLLVSMIALKDPRYSLPLLVYIAVLSTAWISALGRRPRLVATGVVVALALVNTVSHDFGVGGVHALRTPWAVNSPIGEYQFKLVNDAGYFEGPPSRNAAPIVSMLKRLRAEGVRRVGFDQASFSIDGYNVDAMTLLAFKADLAYLGSWPQVVGLPTDAWVVQAPIAEGRARPCIVSPLAPHRMGVYVFVGRARDPRRSAPQCP